MKIKTEHIILIALWGITITACNSSQTTNNENINILESENHGYNELANPDNRESFTISSFNTDNPEIDNIERPNKSTIKTELDTTLLFGIWTSEPNGPHADFELTSKSFFVVDYDGNAKMPYELINNNLKIYYNDFIQEGKVISIDKDTLKIMWKDFGYINNYVRWTQ
ncbi:MAG TPA: hypothetical protein VKY44_04810 [Flavobacterium sp.]|nr:hypothetical protein [Flavobacterium sp.]